MTSGLIAIFQQIFFKLKFDIEAPGMVPQVAPANLLSNCYLALMPTHGFFCVSLARVPRGDFVFCHGAREAIPATAGSRGQPDGSALYATPAAESLLSPVDDGLDPLTLGVDSNLES